LYSSAANVLTFATTVFLIDEHGIRLSPAYDLNPSVGRPELTLAMNEAETTCEVSIFRSPSRPAANVLKQVQEAVASWRERATS